MSYALEEYYHVLELAPSATQEDIRGQYKQLVRLHHPDRFLDLDEKSAAEERLKSINEAYRVLSSHAIEGQLVKYMQRELGLVVTPDMLDFGLVERAQQKSATFRVQFEKDVEAVDFVPSEEDSWFRVSKVSHIYGNDLSALEFEVQIDSVGLTAQTYQAWIDIYLDTAMTRMPLSVQVAPSSSLFAGTSLSQLSQFHLPRRWALVMTFVSALFIFTAALAFTNSRSFTQPQASSLAGSVIGHQTNQLYFSLLDLGQPSIYTVVPDSSESAALPRLLTKGRQAAVLAESQLIVFLDKQGLQPQFFLHDQNTGNTRQITTDSTKKSQPVWSNNGRQFAYLAGSGEGAWIGLYDLDREHEYRLPGEVTRGVSNFSWSPDGKTLLFDLWQNEERRIYRMDVPDGELEQLTQFDSWAGTWSPNGREIIVASTEGLYRLDSSGRSLRPISNMPADQPRWSANGLWIAYTSMQLGVGAVSDDPNTNETVEQVARTLWLIEPDGSHLQQVATNTLWHAWSPTGETLGFITGNTNRTVDTHSSASTELFYLWTLTPNEKPRLVAEVNEPFFTWSQ